MTQYFTLLVIEIYSAHMVDKRKHRQIDQPLCRLYNTALSQITYWVGAVTLSPLRNVIYITIPSLSSIACRILIPLFPPPFLSNSIFSLTFFLPQDLEETPARVNESPFEKGWFMKIKLGASGKSEFDKLLDETAYKAHTSADQH